MCWQPAQAHTASVTKQAGGCAGPGSRVQVVAGKVEELTGLPQVDVLVSEPMGTLLVNERMLETYLYARDHYLKPGGHMFPVRCAPAQSQCEGCC